MVIASHRFRFFPVSFDSGDVDLAAELLLTNNSLLVITALVEEEAVVHDLLRVEFSERNAAAAATAPHNDGLQVYLCRRSSKPRDLTYSSHFFSAAKFH